MTADASSTVAGYYPLKVAITPATKLPLNGQIVLSSIVLKNAPSNCLSYITQKDMLSTITCSYASGTVTVVATSFTGGLTELNSTHTVILTIDKVQYNTKMTANDLTAAILDSSGCRIASGTKSSSWAPANPASFSTLAFEFKSDSSTTVGTSTTLVLQLLPLLSVTTTQLVTIELFGGGSSSQNLVCLQIQSSEGSSTTITGFPYSAWSNIVTSSYTNTTLRIPSFVLPSTEAPIKARVTTYSSSIESSTEIVHQQNTSSLHAVRSMTSLN